jgi:transcriptional regulator with XRE-family HTH domain
MKWRVRLLGYAGRRFGRITEVAQALRNAREKRGLSRAQLAEQLKQNPIDPERHLRQIAALSMIAGQIRRQKGLSHKQVAERANLPVELVRDMEAGRILNPETYSIYCLGPMACAPLIQPLKRESIRYPAQSWMRATGRFAGRKKHTSLPQSHPPLLLEPDSTEEENP